MDDHPPARLRALPAPADGASGTATPLRRPGARGSAAAAFCARCGRPPRQVGADTRVCAHCQGGLVLVAAAGAAPRPSDRFVIVDRQLAVSAVSLSAEPLLGLAQDAAIGRPVIELVQPATRESLARNDFLASLRAAARGIGPLRQFAGRTGVEALALRVAPCGPPPGALLVLGLARD